MIRLIGFDADDTLWDNELAFALTQTKFRQILSRFHSHEWIDARLLETERRNVELFGYGAKGFALSMIETAIELTEGRITGSELQVILDAVRTMLSDPVAPLAGVREVLHDLRGAYPLLLITKGDLYEQEAKIARSGLGELFASVEIVSEKSCDKYKALLRKHSLSSDEFLMVGNSVKSDILPVLELGGYAAHIPYSLTWQYEFAEPPVSHPRLASLRSMQELPGVVRRLNCEALA